MISKKLERKIYHVALNLKHLINARQKHFSFIVERNNIISVGWNNPKKTHPLGKRFKYRFHCRHSELHAIQHFPYPVEMLSYYKIINLRLLADNSLGLSKPCFICQDLLEFFGINEIYYSTEKGYQKC